MKSGCCFVTFLFVYVRTMTMGCEFTPKETTEVQIHLEPEAFAPRSSGLNLLFDFLDSVEDNDDGPLGNERFIIKSGSGKEGMRIVSFVQSPVLDAANLTFRHRLTSEDGKIKMDVVVKHNAETAEASQSLELWPVERYCDNVDAKVERDVSLTSSTGPVTIKYGYSVYIEGKIATSDFPYPFTVTSAGDLLAIYPHLPLEPTTAVTVREEFRWTFKDIILKFNGIQVDGVLEARYDTMEAMDAGTAVPKRVEFSFQTDGHTVSPVANDLVEVMRSSSLGAKEVEVGVVIPEMDRSPSPEPVVVIPDRDGSPSQEPSVLVGEQDAVSETSRLVEQQQLVDVSSGISALISMTLMIGQLCAVSFFSAG